MELPKRFGPAKSVSIIDLFFANCFYDNSMQICPPVNGLRALDSLACLLAANPAAVGPAL